MRQLQDVEGKNILILRGVGGRELINSHLTNLGANVQYLEVYQRHLIPIPSHSFEEWRQKGVDTVVVTSASNSLIWYPPRPSQRNSGSNNFCYSFPANG